MAACQGKVSQFACSFRGGASAEKPFGRPRTGLFRRRDYGRSDHPACPCAGTASGLLELCRSGKGHKEVTETIAQELRADLLVEGSVARAGDTVRITRS